MRRAKLTAEDIEWLERRINAAVSSVSPRPQFVDNARARLMREAAQQQVQRLKWWPAAYLMVYLAGLLLIALAVRRQLRR
ncbi:MAG: hypothetical protein ACUVRU_04420 [Anaerolineae bacterium]